jgi:hypothetical protein
LKTAEKAKAAYTQNEEVNRQAEEKVDMLAPPVIEEEKPEREKVHNDIHGNRDNSTVKGG